MTDSSDVFFRDLARGQEVERQVLKIIQKKCPCACIIDKFHGYDIWIPELHKSVEVKYDHMSCETGNIFIEIEYNKKASALISMGRFDEALIAIDEYEKVDKANGGKNSGDIKKLRDKINRGGMRLTYRQIRKHNKRTKKHKKTKKYKKTKKNKRIKKY